MKTLLVKFFQAKGDMLKMPAKMKVPLKFSVKETYPNLLITDGYYYTNIYLTKEAFQDHKKRAGSIKITDLKGFLVDLS